MDWRTVGLYSFQQWVNIAEMNTILLFFSPYDVFSGKFQSTHFLLFRNVKLSRSFLTVQIYFIKSSGNSVPWYLNAKVSIRSFRDSCCCHKSILFWFIANPSVFPCSCFPRPARWFLSFTWASFLKILWIILLDFPPVFEISPIESLSSLRNLTIIFLSSNDVTDFFAMFTMQKVGDRSRGRPEGSFFNSYYIEV